MSLPGFWRHVATVLGDALGAQALPLLAAPLITRMCTPSEMGAFSVWLGVVAVSAIAATLRLETAMILDHEPEQQRVCFSVVFYSASTTALLVSLCALLAHAFGLPALSDQSWGALLLVGVGTWLAAYAQTTLACATSHKAFGKSARAKVWGTGTIALTQLLLPAVPMFFKEYFAGRRRPEFIHGFALACVTLLLLISSHDFTDMLIGATLGAYAQYRYERKHGKYRPPDLSPSALRYPDLHQAVPQPERTGA